MVELTRTVRLCLNPGWKDGMIQDQPRRNTFAGWPTMEGVGVYYEIEVRCRGRIDPVTGYLLNIAEIDRVVRQLATPILLHVLRDEPGRDPASLLPRIHAAVQADVPCEVSELSWRLSPYYHVSIRADDMEHVLISQSFEFAASHRLHCKGLSDEENRKIFGKCNNPLGHGHNYRVEATVARPFDIKGDGFTLADLESIVQDRVIERFDHKHLNDDVSDFRERTPSVENIARICYDLIREPVAAAGAELRRVTVWETEKTSCTYPAS